LLKAISSFSFSIEVTTRGRGGGVDEAAPWAQHSALRFSSVEAVQAGSGHGEGSRQVWWVRVLGVHEVREWETVEATDQTMGVADSKQQLRRNMAG
jgi:hypothetical protein